MGFFGVSFTGSLAASFAGLFDFSALDALLTAFLFPELHALKSIMLASTLPR